MCDVNTIQKWSGENLSLMDISDVRTWMSKVHHERLVLFSGVCICRDVSALSKG